MSLSPNNSNIALLEKYFDKVLPKPQSDLAQSLLKDPYPIWIFSQVEYALQNLNTPVGVATHRLSKEIAESLPFVEKPEMELEQALSKVKDSEDSKAD